MPELSKITRLRPRAAEPMSREQLVQAIQGLAKRLGHVPTPAEARREIGVAFERAAELHFQSQVAAIARALREPAAKADTPPPQLVPLPVKIATPPPQPSVTQSVVARLAPKTLERHLADLAARASEIQTPLDVMLLSGIFNVTVDAVRDVPQFKRNRPTWATLVSAIRSDGPAVVRRAIDLARLVGSLDVTDVRYVLLYFDYDVSELRGINEFQMRITFERTMPRLDASDAVLFELGADQSVTLVATRSGDYSSGIQLNWNRYLEAQAPSAPDDPEFVVAINAALTGRLQQDPNYQRAVHVEPTRDDLRNYVLWHKGNWVEALWVEQAGEKKAMGQLPSTVIVAALMSSSRRTDQVHGLRLLDASQEHELGDNHAKWVYTYSDAQKRRILVRAEGPWAWEIGMAWLESQGDVPRDALERDYLASVWGTRIRAAGTQANGSHALAEVVLWSDVADRVRSEGSAFFKRLIELPHQGVEFTDKLFVADKKRYNGQDRAYGISILNESQMASASTSAAKLRLHRVKTGDEWVITEAKGENSAEVVDPWIASRGIDTRTIMIRSLVAGTLGMRVSLKPDEVASKESLRNELFRPGGLQNLLETRKKMNPDFDAQSRVVTVVVGFRGDEYYGLQVLSDEELKTAVLPKTAAKFRFEKQPADGHKLVHAEGLGHQSIVHKRVFAPDANQTWSLKWDGKSHVSPFDVHRYDTRDPETLVKIIATDFMVATDVWFGNAWRYRLHDPKADQWYLILKGHLLSRLNSGALRSLPKSILDALGDRLMTLHQIAIVMNGYCSLYNLSYEILMSPRRVDLLLLMTLQNPAAVPYLNKYPGTTVSTGQDPTMEGDETVKVWFRHVLDHRKISESYEAAIDADTSRQDVMTVLAYALYRHLTVNPDKVADYWKSGPSAVSRYLIADILGIHPDFMQGRSYSSRYVGDFYELAIRLQQGLMEPALQAMHLAPELFHARDLRKIIALMENLNRLKGALVAEERVLRWKDVLVDLNVTTITVDSIDTAIARIDAEFQKRFQDTFRLGGRPIRPSQITALEKRWGSLEVLFTLASRFHATPSLQEELPLLGRVVEAVLNDRFAQLKYEGAPGDEREGWMANYQTVGVFVPSGRHEQRSLYELWRRSQHIIEQALQHAFEAAGDVTDQMGIVHDIVSELRTRPVPVTIQKNKKEPRLLTVALLRLMKDSDTAEEYLGWLGLMKAASGTLRLSAQLTEDLRSLDGAMTYRDASSEAIVYTTITDDPHLLLKIGNLVDVSSCQDYRYGQCVETLLGYVVDANVKAVLSFALTRKHFVSSADYERAKQLAKDPETPLVFDAPRLMLKIGDVEVQLPKAHIRRIIKLGSVETGEAGLGLEPEYYQNHFAESEMRRQINTVVHAQAQGAGAVLGQTVQLPASRNPAGVYSDNANPNGAQLKPYALPHSGGRIQAPDADDMERISQLVAALGKEGYGNLEEQVCKPEPLITPAEVIQVPQMEYPADAVDLPKMGGYLTLDPEELKQMQVPPSDKIPIVTGSRQLEEKNHMIDSISPTRQVFNRAYIRSGRSVTAGVASVFDSWFIQLETEKPTMSRPWYLAKSGALGFGKVAATLAMGIPEMGEHVLAEFPKGPVPFFAKIAQVMIEGPFDGAKALGSAMGQSVRANSQLSAGQRVYAWTQMGSHLAMMVAGAVKVGGGAGNWMNKIGPDAVSITFSEAPALVAVPAVSIPFPSAPPVMGAFMMTASQSTPNSTPPDFAAAADTVRRGVENKTISPDEAIALWRLLIPQMPERLSRQMIYEVLGTLPAIPAAVPAVVAFLERTVDFMSRGPYVLTIRHTIDPQFKGARAWAKMPELWQGYIAVLANKRPEKLPALAHEFLKWAAKLKDDVLFAEAVPGLWQQLLDGVTAVVNPIERNRIQGRLGDIMKNRPGMTPAMKETFDKVSTQDSR